jgi:hypothetical protein
MPKNILLEINEKTYLAALKRKQEFVQNRSRSKKSLFYFFLGLFGGLIAGFFLFFLFSYSPAISPGNAFFVSLLVFIGFFLSGCLSAIVESIHEKNRIEADFNNKHPEDAEILKEPHKETHEDDDSSFF